MSKHLVNQIAVSVVISSAALLFYIVISILLFMQMADAHDAIPTASTPLGWKYPWACCSNMDCKEVEAKGVSERPEGYIILSTGEVIGYADKRVKDSPDGEYHWCAHQAGLDAGHTICLFVPPKGF